VGRVQEIEPPVEENSGQRAASPFCKAEILCFCWRCSKRYMYMGHTFGHTVLFGQKDLLKLPRFFMNLYLFIPVLFLDNKEAIGRLRPIKST
jgi:hypothetical protein